MINLFRYVENFFDSLSNYLTDNSVFVIFLGLFLFTILIVLISTSNSYESRLISAIDMFNNYFINNPEINEDNLVAFNLKMKSKKVPRQLRKQWQQYVLYKEQRASYYMSFDTCVSTPIKNSTYTRDVKTMNIIAYILAGVSLIINIFNCNEIDVVVILQKILLTPMLILLLNLLATIFLNLKHNAIVSDLYINYPYFEVNIDKATKTMPDYVDYEVLFDKNEIKKGIPILYAYLQKRAEEEQKELERARLKNIQHEEFNFDETGEAGAQVLERAMQEAENYILERKNFSEKIESINSDIAQEDLNYREYTKEYQRQMQVSRETFANFKEQLEQSTSNIQTNYIRKQQQQELDRQRNLERDFDTATERHNKVIETLNLEIAEVDEDLKKAKKILQSSMMSEFDTYNSKVYEAASKTVQDNQQNIIGDLQSKISELEQALNSKNKELESINNYNNDLINQINAQNKYYQELQPQSFNNSEVNNVQNTENEQVDNQDFESETEEQPIQSNDTYEAYVPQTDYYNNQVGETEQYVPQTDYYNNQFGDEEQDNQSDEINQVEDNQFGQETENNDEDGSYAQGLNETYMEEESDDLFDFNDLKEAIEDDNKNSGGLESEGENSNSSEQNNSVVPNDESKPKKKAGRPRKVVQEEPAKIKKSRGRPRKAETTEVAETEPKKTRGRPRKTEATAEVKTEQVEPKKTRGRPKKQTDEKVKDSEQKAVKISDLELKKTRGRPRKTEVITEQVEPKKTRGRPKKIVEIDEVLQQIDSEMAKENAKIEEAKKKLAKKASIKKKK